MYSMARRAIWLKPIAEFAAAQSWFPHRHTAQRRSTMSMHASGSMP